MDELGEGGGCLLKKGYALPILLLVVAEEEVCRFSHNLRVVCYVEDHSSW